MLSGIERAKVLLEAEYAQTGADGRRSVARTLVRVVDLDGNGRGDVVVRRRFDENGRYTDSFTLRNDRTLRDGTTLALGGKPGVAPIENNWRSHHDETTLTAGEDGVIRSEHHFDYANGEQRNVYLSDENRDGKIDFYSLSTKSGGARELTDTDGDGRLDREWTSKDGKVATRAVREDPFFLDEK